MAYASRFGKSHQTRAEFDAALELFRQADESINAWNAQENITHRLGHNWYSDVLKPKKKNVPHKTKRKDMVFTSFADKDLPEEVNWVEKGAVTPVQKQFLCEANWAFSAVGTIEGSYFNKHGELVPLAAQQCIDCDVEEGANWDNCDGGWADDCIQYAIMRPLALEKDFPFQHIQRRCTEEQSEGPVQVD